MKFITLSKSQYTITNKPTLLDKLIIVIKVLLIIMSSLVAGYEHLEYEFRRTVETMAIDLVSYFIMPKRGRVYA